MKKHCFILIFLAISLHGFTQQKTLNPEFGIMLDNLLTHTVKEVLPKDIKEDSDIIYLDAREKNEYKISHISNATWVGYSSFKLKRVAEIPKDKKIIVYCSVGYRSEKIAEKLIASGYTNVSNLYGGIFEWVHNDFTLVDKKGEETQEVHTYDKEWGQWLTKGIKKD